MMLTALDLMTLPLQKREGVAHATWSRRATRSLYPYYAPAPTALTRVSGLRLCAIRPKYVL